MLLEIKETHVSEHTVGPGAMVTDNADLKDRKRVKASPDLPFSQPHRCVTVAHRRARQTARMFEPSVYALRDGRVGGVVGG